MEGIMKTLFFWGFRIFLLTVIIGISGLLSFYEDSQVLSWNTFMGSSGQDSGSAIAVDGSGNVYVTGNSSASWGTPVNAHAGGDDAFVAKFDSNGILQWNTFMGGSGGDWGSYLTLDGSGNVYVAGRSDATWGTPVNAYAGGPADAFAAKLNSSGVLQWNTFLGGDDLYGDAATGLTLDTSGNIYVVGYSDVSWGTPINPYVGGDGDAFVVKLNNSGALQWNTFMGGGGEDYGTDIVLDTGGNIYITGGSWGPWGMPINPYTGFMDAIVVKLNSSGVLQWNTFMGGGNWDDGSELALDGSGNIYVAGYSGETWGTPVNAYSGSSDGFAAKLNSSGVLQWNTFMGSSGWDKGFGIALDTAGDAYIAGQSDNTWGTPINAYAGSYDAFAMKLDSSGVRQWNTFLGSSASDESNGIAMDGSGIVYVTGNSYATWGTPVNAHAGGYDAFIAELSEEAEINVRMAGINFADGSIRNLGTKPSSFIMGRDFTFRIENHGFSPLNLTGSPMVTLSGPQATHFYISQQPSSPVSGFGTTTFKLRTVRDSLPGFLPIGWSYPVSITINIPNDDSDENPYDFTINFTLEKD
jgi:hypothetical protein